MYSLTFISFFKNKVYKLGQSIIFVLITFLKKENPVAQEPLMMTFQPIKFVLTTKYGPCFIKSFFFFSSLINRLKSTHKMSEESFDTSSRKMFDATKEVNNKTDNSNRLHVTIKHILNFKTIITLYIVLV